MHANKIKKHFCIFEKSTIFAVKYVFTCAVATVTLDLENQN